MADHKESIIQLEDKGSMRISDDVIASIASMAASEVEGVSMMTTVGTGVSDLIGKRQITKGVKILQEEGKFRVIIHIVVAYGKVVPTVAKEVQERAMSALENMTGLSSIEVDIHVGGIAFEKVAKTEKSRK